ncbi:hypothetical protein EYC80_005071 [Monilinia laxa]|uniref:Uncharacterized protein n=1 Tax=Monilinia laxa TaxID=61186 RepID=A0A5N6KJC6_MONLA|nr:hypothetical protein EYC80_005071 [Monilinia laxa]
MRERRIDATIINIYWAEERGLRMKCNAMQCKGKERVQDRGLGMGYLKVERVRIGMFFIRDKSSYALSI